MCSVKALVLNVQPHWIQSLMQVRDGQKESNQIRPENRISPVVIQSSLLAKLTPKNLIANP